MDALIVQFASTLIGGSLIPHQAPTQKQPLTKKAVEEETKQQQEPKAWPSTDQLRLERAQSHYQLQRNESRIDITEDAWFMDNAYMPAYNAKMRKAIQAKQAWVGRHENETPTPSTAVTNSPLTKKANLLTQKKRSTQGGPHDIEFFRCFMTYLEEALIQISEGHPEDCECCKKSSHDSILSQCSSPERVREHLNDA